MSADESNLICRGEGIGWVKREPLPSPATTLAAWTDACLSSGHGGGDNLLRAGKERFVIGAGKLLGNGAMVGRMSQFTKSGLSDIGGYKIAADGRVLAIPAAMRGLLPGTEHAGVAA